MGFTGNLSMIGQASPNNKLIQKFFAVYLLLVFILCLIINTLLILVFVQYKKTRTPLNNIVLMITVINLLGSIQFVIHSIQFCYP